MCLPVSGPWVDISWILSSLITGVLCFRRHSGHLHGLSVAGEILVDFGEESCLVTGTVCLLSGIRIS